MRTTSIDQTAPVLVTGGTGYIAGWIIKELLEAGRTVHATVRDPNKRAALEHLRQLAAAGPGKLRLFQADLLQPAAFDEASAGCELIMHTASPFPWKRSRDPERELLRPAVEGTRNLLGSVSRSAAAKRVVLTSSIMAIYGDAIENVGLASGKFDETCWNTSSSLAHQPYPYSKVMAEREAWRLYEAQTPRRWELVVINPALVLGPALTPHTQSGSISVLSQLTGGRGRAGVPRVHTCLVDVRDVAHAHVLAGELEAAHGRYLLVADTLTLLEMAERLHRHYPDLPLPRNEVPKWLLWLVAPFVGLQRSFVSANVGYPIAFDQARSRNELGVCYRPLEETLVDHVQQLIADGMLRRRRRPRLPANNSRLGNNSQAEETAVSNVLRS